MSHRIIVTAQTNTAHVFSGHITDELTGDEIATKTKVGWVTFQRFSVRRALVGTGIIETPLDVTEIELFETEHQLYDTLQPGLEYSTTAIPYTFLWRVPERREPFFPAPGTFYVVLRFYPRDGGEVEKLIFEATVT